MNYALEHAYNAGETVKVRKGTKIREVSAKRMLAEREVYSKASLDDERGVQEQLSRLKLSRDRTHLIKEYMNSVGDILAGLLVEDASEEE